MATGAGSYIVPTMQMTQEDLGELRADTLPCQAVWKFSRGSQGILDAQRLLASSEAKVAFGTDCGMFPFSHGIREFQAMVAAGLTPVRALKAGTAVAAELLGREDIGVLKPGACADIVAMPGNPSRTSPPPPTSTSYARWARAPPAGRRAAIPTSRGASGERRPSMSN